MPRGKTVGKVLLSAVVFIALEIAALGILHHNAEIQGLWMSRVSHRIMAVCWGGVENVKGYFTLRKCNDKLALENSKLTEQVSNLNAALSQRLAREKVSDFGGDDFIYTPASIVKMSKNSQHNYFIIDKGSEDGVTPQSGIITDKGAIGIIDAVEKHYSFGLSFMNSGLNISTRIGKEGAIGPLSWDGRSKNGALLKEIPLQYKFERGDTVWTSGFSSIFPPDIPLGVAGESRIINGAVNEIKIELFENFAALRYVTVVTNKGQSEIDALETSEGGHK